MFTLTRQSLTKLLIALGIYVTSLIAANTLGLKLMPFFFGLHLSVAVFSFPVVFLMTDVIGEVYGKQIARMFVVTGFVTTALFIAYTLISLVVPWDQSSAWVKEGYVTVFGISVRIAIASLLAFLIGEYQDLSLFFFLKSKMKDKNFWIRSNLSNLWSQFLDTCVFMIVAFAGVYPWRTLVSIIFTWWMFKVLMGLLYTPLSYLALSLLKNNES